MASYLVNSGFSLAGVVSSDIETTSGPTCQQIGSKNCLCKDIKTWQNFTACSQPEKVPDNCPTPTPTPSPTPTPATTNTTTSTSMTPIRSVPTLSGGANPTHTHTNTTNTTSPTTTNTTFTTSTTTSTTTTTITTTTTTT